MLKVIGIGIDIQEVERVHPFSSNERILERIFSSEELEYMKGRVDRDQHIAGRFAVKEAVIKSLAMPRERGLELNMIEVFRDPNGKPFCKLRGGPKERLEEMGGNEIMISLSHGLSSVVGVAICTGD